MQQNRALCFIYTRSEQSQSFSTSQSVGEVASWFYRVIFNGWLWTPEPNMLEIEFMKLFEKYLAWAYTAILIEGM